MINPSSFRNDLIFMGNPVLLEQSHLRSGWMLLSSGAIFTVKPPVRILVHRSLLGARLYLISPTPRILEVIILEKCGTRPELFNDYRWERMRSYIAMLQRPKSRMGMVWRAGTGRGIFQHPPRKASGIKRNSHENHVYQLLFGIGTLLSISCDECRRPRKGCPRGGLVTIQNPPGPLCLGEALNRG